MTIIHTEVVVKYFVAVKNDSNTRDTTTLVIDILFVEILLHIGHLSFSVRCS